MNALEREAVLRLLPQQPPMRFISEILELDEEHILSRYTWTEEDCAGHFPGYPIVPGVKILECAAQTGCVAWGIYHLKRSHPEEDLRGRVGFFTGIESASFLLPVRPRQTVTALAVFGEEGYFRGEKIQSEVSVRLLEGMEVFRGILSGVWQPKPQEAYAAF